MWSFGCILGEMLSEKPLFAGKTIVDQIERIMSFVGYPSTEDLASLKSEHANELFQNVKVKKMPPSYWFKDASTEAIDLVYKLLKFNPKHRLTLK
jgi:serine/threonine protein kinase